VALDLPVDGIAGLGAGDPWRGRTSWSKAAEEEVADVREHAADREARVGAFAGLVVAPAEIRVLLDAHARETALSAMAMGDWLRPAARSGDAVPTSRG
jgi:hypothetical protein